MKTWLKWLIGIVVVVLIVGGIAAGAYWMHTQALAGNTTFYGRGMMQWRGFDRDFGPGGMMGRGFERGFGGGMMGGRGGFGGLLMLPLMLLRGLLPLALLGFAIYGIVVWFKRGKAAPAPAAVTAAAAPAEKTCGSCGQSVQADWKHCPHCGNTL